MLYIWPWQAPALPPRAVDLLHDHRRLGEAQARAAVLLRDQRRQPAGAGERSDEGLGVGALGVDLAEVFVGELPAQSCAPRRGGPGARRGYRTSGLFRSGAISWRGRDHACAGPTPTPGPPRACRRSRCAIASVSSKPASEHDAGGDPGPLPAAGPAGHPGHRRRPGELAQRRPLLHPAHGGGQRARPRRQAQRQREQRGRDQPADARKRQHRRVAQPARQAGLRAAGEGGHGRQRPWS